MTALRRIPLALKPIPSLFTKLVQPSCMIGLLEPLPRPAKTPRLRMTAYSHSLQEETRCSTLSVSTTTATFKVFMALMRLASLPLGRHLQLPLHQTLFWPQPVAVRHRAVSTVSMEVTTPPTTMCPLMTPTIPTRTRLYFRAPQIGPPLAACIQMRLSQPDQRAIRRCKHPEAFIYRGAPTFPYTRTLVLLKNLKLFPAAVQALPA